MLFSLLFEFEFEFGMLLSVVSVGFPLDIMLLIGPISVATAKFEVLVQLSPFSSLQDDEEQRSGCRCSSFVGIGNDTTDCNSIDDDIFDQSERYDCDLYRIIRCLLSYLQQDFVIGNIVSSVVCVCKAFWMLFVPLNIALGENESGRP
jgi:hypothetical protein